MTALGTPHTRDTHDTFNAQDGPVVEEGPLRVVACIARLLRSLPPPIEVMDARDPAVLVTWLGERAELCERVATACADPGLAAEATAIAAAARRTLAALAVPVVPVVSSGGVL